MTGPNYPSPTAPIAELKNVSLAFGDKVVLDEVNLSFPAGKITVLAGPSGTGKTTLLRLLTGQQRPDAGTVQLAGQDVDTRQRNQLYRQRRMLGMLFQSGALFPHLNVFENVAFPVREHLNLSNDLVKVLVWLKLEAVGLRGAAELLPEQLSGGMARRVALARATVLDPELMLYDEPLTGQDPISVGVLLELIAQINQTYRSSAIIVSHQLHHMARIAHHMVIVAKGRILAQGSPQELMESQDPQTFQFIHGRPDGVVPFHAPAKPLAEELRAL